MIDDKAIIRESRRYVPCSMCWFTVTFMCDVLPDHQIGDPIAAFKLAVFTTSARRAIEAVEVTPGFIPGTALCRGVTDAHLKLLREYTTARRIY